jgi:hypothetical protein
VPKEKGDVKERDTTIQCFHLHFIWYFYLTCQIFIEGYKNERFYTASVRIEGLTTNFPYVNEGVGLNLLT